MRLLLDADVPAAIAEDLRRRGIDVLSIQEWQQASYRHARDNNILEAAATDERTLVTFDLSTIPDLLRELAATGRHHGGVILVDDKTYNQNDVGGISRALRVLIDESGAASWLDVV